MQSPQWASLVGITDIKHEGDVLDVGASLSRSGEVLNVLPRGDTHAIYVRPAYVKLAGLMMDKLAISEGGCGIGLTGTPGVGKSVFLWYVLCAFRGLLLQVPRPSHVA